MPRIPDRNRRLRHLFHLMCVWEDVIIPYHEGGVVKMVPDFDEVERLLGGHPYDGAYARRVLAALQAEHADLKAQPEREAAERAQRDAERAATRADRAERAAVAAIVRPLHGWIGLRLDEITLLLREGVTDPVRYQSVLRAMAISIAQTHARLTHTQPTADRDDSLHPNNNTTDSPNA